MPRLLFEKKGNAVWISHLDLMRLFQRAFKRSGLLLTHTQGFNPRPSVSIALPLSVGVESCCELLDFDLYGEPVSDEEILRRLNSSLVEGVRVLSVYSNGSKIKNLALLECEVIFEFDNGIPENAVIQLRELFSSDEVTVEKKTKNGIKEENVIPMIRSIHVEAKGEHTVTLHAVVCCQNPTLNPMQLSAAVKKYLPHIQPDFVKCKRLEIFDTDEKIFR